jgi:hypothetical protein
LQAKNIDVDSVGEVRERCLRGTIEARGGKE